MVNKSSVRSKNKNNFIKCVELRKQGLSYSEIRKIVPIAKSTLNNWLTLAGLTLTAEHLNIQRTKRLQNHVIATEAARITRQRKTQKAIDIFLSKHKKEVLDTLLVSGSMLYEAEGGKTGACRFSNSDYRVIVHFLRFIERYFERDKLTGMVFRVYIHKNRESDLGRVLIFWSRKLGIPKDKIAISWKVHKADIRNNRDYVGQMSVTIRRSAIIRKQIKAISDIILNI